MPFELCRGKILLNSMSVTREERNMKRATIGLLAVTLCLSMLLGGCGKNQARKVTIGKATPTPAAQEAAVSASSAPAQDTSKSTAQTGVEVDIKRWKGCIWEKTAKRVRYALWRRTAKLHVFLLTGRIRLRAIRTGR